MNAFPGPITHLRRSAYGAAFKAAGAFGRCEMSDTIVLAGPPRSGTTILQEVLQHIPGYKTVNEPLLTRETQRRHGFTRRPWIAEHADAPVQRAFIERALTGRLGAEARWSFNATNSAACLIEHATSRKLLVKFVRLNRMLPWFNRNFAIRGLCLVARHPASVVSSMLRFGQWERDYERLLKGEATSLSLEHLPESMHDRMGPVIEAACGSQIEALTALVAIDLYFPLVHDAEQPWVLMPYERLVMQGQAELDRVNEALGVETNQRMLDRLKRPSSSVKGRFVEDPARQIAKWQEQLSAEQIGKVVKILRLAGLDHIYGDAAEPDYAALNLRQMPKYRWVDANRLTEPVAPSLAPFGNQNQSGRNLRQVKRLAGQIHAGNEERPSRPGTKH